jgi:cell division protein FtsL
MTSYERILLSTIITALLFIASCIIYMVYEHNQQMTREIQTMCYYVDINQAIEPCKHFKKEN